ncbi:MAG TPA: DALR anticodon-binding domain-containing protein [Rhizomicrobium sp.]|nr:DALR anticodon-binding domain-containing protein [Rhizomicrobium sp.]
MERFSKFEGKTGPYLQYAAVRIQSILRKAKEQDATIGTAAVHSPEERRLILQLLSLGDVMAAAEDKRAPNILCEYAFELAQNFSRFYGEHHILSESDEGLRAARLGLCALVLAVSTQVLSVLGIEIPARM